MSPGMTARYISEVSTLAEKYKDEIEVFLGLEQDFLSDKPPEGLEYIIGSVHNIIMGEDFTTVDAGAKHQKIMVDTFFGGDYYSMAEEYYSIMSGLIGKTNADIVGHFDLVSKYNFGGRLFDETNPRYINAALGAMDSILADCKIFEVNTGAMFRLGKAEPYPSVFLLKELHKRGGEVILTSDSHDAESLFHKFGEMRELLKDCGFKHIKRLTKDGFIDQEL